MSPELVELTLQFHPHLAATAMSYHVSGCLHVEVRNTAPSPRTINMWQQRVPAQLRVAGVEWMLASSRWVSGLSQSETEYPVSVHIYDKRGGQG